LIRIEVLAPIGLLVFIALLAIDEFHDD